MPYTVTIYVAAPGTPLALGENGATSLPGHMYYVTSDGQNRNSYGLAPVKHGDINGPGKVYDNDEKNYTNPRYSRTLEITKEQYDNLNNFGKNPKNYNFDTYYKDTRNNCVDFVWAGLNSAGLHARISLPFLQNIERKNYEGALKPNNNIEDIKSIKPPFPDSPLNSEKLNPMPKRGVVQWLLSEEHQFNEQPNRVIGKTQNIDDMFEALYSAALTKDHASARAIGQAYAQSSEGQAMFAEGRQFNQQQQVTLLAQQTLAEQQPVQRGPVMRL